MPMFGKAMRDLLSKTYKNAVPTYVRTYGESVLGNRAPITENDFNEKELQALRSLITSPRKGDLPNVVGYYDYPKANKELKNDGAFLGGGESYFDPNSTSLANTIGAFKYKKQPDGSYTIDDSYDWDATFPVKPKSLLSAVKQAGVLEGLGAYLMPDKTSGRPIHIKVK